MLYYKPGHPGNITVNNVKQVSQNTTVDVKIKNMTSAGNCIQSSDIKYLENMVMHMYSRNISCIKIFLCEITN